MKFDAHVSNVGFILYLVAQVIPEPQKADQSFVPRFLYSPIPNSHLHMPGDRHPDICYEQLSPVDRHQLRTCRNGHMRHAAALVSEAPAQPDDSHAGPDAPVSYIDSLPAARNHERKFRHRICGDCSQQYQLFPFPALRTPALHAAMPRLPPRNAPYPRDTAQDIQASLQTLRTLYRLAKISVHRQEVSFQTGPFRE